MFESCVASLVGARLLFFVSAECAKQPEKRVGSYIYIYIVKYLPTDGALEDES